MFLFRITGTLHGYYATITISAEDRADARDTALCDYFDHIISVCRIR